MRQIESPALTWRLWLRQVIGIESAQNPGLWEAFHGATHLLDEAWVVPSSKDKEAAWELYVELRTRISTQPLHFLDGDEGTALDSLYKLFQIVRDLEKKHGADSFQTSTLTNLVLNVVLRPVTAKWHKRLLAGELNRDDACREFRSELKQLQPKLRDFQRLLLQIARPQVRDDGGEHERRQVQPATSLLPSIAYDRLLGLDSGSTFAGKDQAGVIRDEEKREIGRRRKAITGQPQHPGVPDEPVPEIDDVVGLAISGGGIRSATFALGVVQGLVRRGMLQHVDVMSTVSGGGYLGSFLSSFLNTDANTHEQCGPTGDKAPFKRDGNPLIETADEAPAKWDVVKDSAATRFLRNHSTYILPSGFGAWTRAIGMAAFGVLANFVILFTLVFWGVLATHLMESQELQSLYAVVLSGRVLESWWWAPSVIAKCCWGFAVALVVMLPLVQRVGRLGVCRRRLRTMFEWGTLRICCLALLITGIEYLPIAHYGYLRLMHAIGEWLPSHGSKGWSWTATFVAIGQAATFILARSQWLQKLGLTRPQLKAIFTVLLAIAGPMLMLYVYFELSRVYIASPPKVAVSLPQVWRIPELFGEGLTSQQLLWCLAIGGSVVSLIQNINFSSLHRYYRNRLCETYLLRWKSQTEVTPVDPQLLSELRQEPQSTAPYHLINGALNLQASTVPELRGRDCDFFLFSKHYCGSPILGYRPTTEWQNYDAHLDLGTAMAISGAAASPQMGTGTDRSKSFLLTMLNVRLGYWLRRPDRGCMPAGLVRTFGAPGPLCLFREALNWVDEKENYVNVTDGGHIENLGVYELLRRRCKYIIAIDGECDPQLDFPSLMQLQRFAEIDFRVRIDLNPDRIRWVTSKPVAPAKDADKNHNANEFDTASPPPPTYSRAHFAFGQITYPDDGSGNPAVGWLIYIKLSVTGNEPPYVLDYRLRHPDFPHQSTSDQIFEEDQFEAYRRLGEHITDDLFSDELLEIANPPNGTAKTKLQLDAAHASLRVSDWFHQLATNLWR